MTGIYEALADWGKTYVRDAPQVPEWHTKVGPRKWSQEMLDEFITILQVIREVEHAVYSGAELERTFDETKLDYLKEIQEEITNV